MNRLVTLRPEAPARQTVDTPVVELNGITVGYGDRIIQEEMSFAVDQGEFIAVLGPNGAGKSTLFKLILGLLRPTVGTLRVLGEPPRKGNPRIGYAPQFRRLENDYAIRARDLVRFGIDGHLWGTGWPSRKRNKVVDAALSEVNATGYADSPVAELSGGERQRLWIAQALLSKPRLLLLDEPLASLDLARASEIVALIDRVRQAHRVAVLLVTHDVNPLLSHIDRVLYMANRRSAVGTRDEVITSTTLTRLYGRRVDVVEAGGKLFVVGVDL